MNLWQRTKNVITRLASLVTGFAPNTRVTDDDNWNLLQSGNGPNDRQWREVQDDLKDALEAWRKNFMIRQIIRLQTAFVLGDDGIRITSKRRDVAKFIDQFWNHRPVTPDGRILPPNNLSQRLPSWLDELQRAGEIFVILFPNAASGMSQVRTLPAASIHNVECDPDDYEKELYYYQTTDNPLEPKKWPSPLTAKPKEPVMLHYTINKPAGATRGESDLTPILPWAKRYSEWLKDRVRFNRLKTELAGVELRTKGDITERQKQIKANPPTGGNIAVTEMGSEELIFHSANIDGGDAEPDGRAQRLAIATGANVPLHFFAEGDNANRATAVEMGDPTHRFYRQRQNEIVDILMDLCEQAYRRKIALGIGTLPRDGDLKLEAETPDISRADNTALAGAASTIVNAFAVMKSQGWITDELAIRLAFKFAGEVLEESEIQAILNAPKEPEEDPEDDDEGQDGGQMSSTWFESYALRGANGNN